MYVYSFSHLLTVQQKMFEILRGLFFVPNPKDLEYTNTCTNKSYAPCSLDVGKDFSANLIVHLNDWHRRKRIKDVDCVH